MTAQSTESDEPLGRTPPHDAYAEQCVLGGAMLSTDACRDVLEILTAGDFYRPAHETIFGAIAALTGSGKPVDIVAIAAELMSMGEINRIGGHPYLHTLISSVPTASNAGYYAQIVRDRAMLRAVVRASEHAAQMAYSPGGADAHEIAERASQEMSAVRDHGRHLDDVDTPSAGEFMAQTFTHDWLVPGLIERGDRLILTGAEGGGKSTLVRQMAVAVASGIHPFDNEPIDPGLVLIVDCENGKAHVQRQLAKLARCTATAGVDVADWLLWIETRPEGIDLLDPGDARWLLRRVEAIRPAVVTIGPIYKLHAANPNDEEPTRKVQRVLDQVRAMGCALLIEAHYGHGDSKRAHPDVRPSGSRLWMRWPEFGVGLRLADDEFAAEQRLMDVVHWRGPREERTWPRRLCAGTRWPWEVAR